FQAEDGIRDDLVTGVQTCALPISVPVFPTEVNPHPTEQPCVKAGQELLDPRHGLRRAGFDFRMDDESHDIALRSFEAIRPRARRSEERRVGKECRSRLARYDAR